MLILIYLSMYIHKYITLFLYIYLYIYIYIYTLIFSYLFVYIHICICTYTLYCITIKYKNVDIGLRSCFPGAILRTAKIKNKTKTKTGCPRDCILSRNSGGGASIGHWRAIQFYLYTYII